MKKKILFILHIPPPVHGSSVVGLQIKSSFTINDEFNCRYINLGTSNSIDEIGKQGFVKLFRFASIWFSVLRQLLFFRPELCYFAITAKGVAFYKDASIVFLVKIFGVNLVYHFHNKGVATKQDNWFDNLLYQFVFKHSDVVLLSKYLYADIKKYVSKERVYYCPNGISDLEGDKRVANRNDDKSIVKILFLSNLIETKGVYVLLQACKILNDKGVLFHCTFVGGIGDVSEKQFCDRTQLLALENRVVYLGEKHGIEKQAEFEKTDIFVFPTFFETFGIVNLEAMQFSLPIVSTFEGGIPDIVEDGVTGFLVQQKDTQALADKLEILINNTELRCQMGTAGRAKYEKEFTSEQFEKKMLQILKTTI